MIKLWDQQGKLIREISGHTDAVRALLQVDLGLCSAANDGFVSIFFLSLSSFTISPQCIELFECGH